MSAIVTLWLRLTGQRQRIFWRFVTRQLRAARVNRPNTHRVDCAWCRDCIRRGHPRLPVSHGICKPCRDKTLAGRIQSYCRPAVTGLAASQFALR